MLILMTELQLAAWLGLPLYTLYTHSYVHSSHWLN